MASNPEAASENSQAGDVTRIAEANAETAASMVEAAVENTVMIAENTVAAAEERAEQAEAITEAVVGAAVEQASNNIINERFEGLEARCLALEEGALASLATLTATSSAMEAIQAQLSLLTRTATETPPPPPPIPSIPPASTPIEEADPKTLQVNPDEQTVGEDKPESKKARRIRLL